MTVEKQTKAAVAGAPADGVVKPKMRRAAGPKKEVAAQEMASAGQTPAGEENMRFSIDAIKSNGEVVSREATNDPDIAMRAYVKLSQADFGKEHGGGSYVALTDREFKLDAGRTAEGNGTYKVQFSKKEGRLAFEAMEKVMQSEVDQQEHHGVSVKEVVAGFVVSFPFDRRLAEMMDGVPNAVFNKEHKVYEVPSVSAVPLAKVVSEMRVESQAIAADLESIMALAKVSGIGVQNTHLTAPGAAPRVSSFIDPGKAYRGEIVNANSRFVAQFTGFGKQDGAAFLTIHRLASLDNRNLLKGEKVGIVYDGKFRGAVTDLTRNKSAAELKGDYEVNLGQQVDGVTVSDRGDKIGVAFEINPNMVARIQRVDGAAFNKGDKTWEIPKAKQEFALFAVQDLRDEFVVDTKDRAALHQVAESKIDGAKVWPAFTKDGQGYYGKVLAVGDRYALQNSGRGNFTLHHLSALDQEPIKDHNLDIQYKKGVGMVHDKDQQRGQDRGR